MEQLLNECIQYKKLMREAIQLIRELTLHETHTEKIRKYVEMENEISEFLKNMLNDAIEKLQQLQQSDNV